jgi:hypothetical protein
MGAFAFNSLDCMMVEEKRPSAYSNKLLKALSGKTETFKK